MRRVATAVAMVAAAVAAVGVAGSTAAYADPNGPILYASRGDWAHYCVVIGTDTVGNQGVVCSDLIALTWNGVSADPAVVGQIEIICQKDGVPEQCAEAHTKGVLSNAAFADESYPYQGDCGHQYGACSTGRNLYPTKSYGTTFIGNCQTDLPFNWWNVVYGNGSTSIELPGSGEWVYLTSTNAPPSGNLSSGHHQICW